MGLNASTGDGGGRILLIGGTGKLGHVVTQRLITFGASPLRVMTRDPAAARSAFGDAIEIIAGSPDQAGVLEAAFAEVDRLFLLTPITARLADIQISAIAAAERAGVGRIVKISGSNWSIENRARSRAGAAHSRVEERLAASPIPSVSLRPNAWTQVSLAGWVAAWRAGVRSPLPDPDAPVSYIDIGDIADVAVHALTSAALPKGPLVLTGPEALTVRDVQSLLDARSDVPAAPAGNPPPHARDPFHAEASVEFRQLIAEGRAAPVTTTVAGLLDRPATTVADFIRTIA